MKYIKITIGMFLFTLGITLWIYDVDNTGWVWWNYISFYINMIIIISFGLFLLDNKE